MHTRARELDDPCVPFRTGNSHEVVSTRSEKIEVRKVVDRICKAIEAREAEQRTPEYRARNKKNTKLCASKPVRATAYDRDEVHNFRPQSSSAVAAGQVQEIMSFKA